MPPLGPGAPGERGRRQAVGAAVLGEGVQEDVRGRVVALARRRRTYRRRRRRGRTPRGRPGEFVQVESRVHLGTKHRVQPLGSQRGDDPVVQHTGGVHHRRSPSTVPTPRPAPHGPPHRRPRRSPRHPAQPARPPVPPHPAHPRRGATAAGGERTPCSATRWRATSAPSMPVRAGDQHRTVRAEHRQRLDLRGNPGQPGHQHAARADREFGLTRGRAHPAERGTRPPVVVQVEQDEAAGVLRLRRADQTPNRRLCKVGETARVGGHRTTGHDDQAGRRRTARSPASPGPRPAHRAGRNGQLRH